MAGVHESDDPPRALVRAWGGKEEARAGLAPLPREGFPPFAMIRAGGREEAAVLRGWAEVPLGAAGLRPVHVQC